MLIPFKSNGKSLYESKEFEGEKKATNSTQQRGDSFLLDREVWTVHGQWWGYFCHLAISFTSTGTGRTAQPMWITVYWPPSEWQPGSDHNRFRARCRFMPASFILLGITYIHTLFIAACTAETCKILLLHLRKLITSDQVWSQYYGKHYLTSDLLHLQRRKGRKKCMKIVEEKMSSLRMSVKLQRSLDNFNGLKREKVCKRKSSDSTPQYAAAKWPS